MFLQLLPAEQDKINLQLCGLFLFSSWISFTLPLVVDLNISLPVQNIIMLIRAGILSDTHLIQPDNRFVKQVKQCFQSCDIIIHAGDITSSAILDVFNDKTLHAVHGNMCAPEVHNRLPEHTTFQLGRFTIGLTHGARLGHDIETALWDLFPEVDCMIYGHTHRPACSRQGHVLIINPGSFQATGRYGAPGTYAILEAGDELKAEIFQIPPPL